ncbi:hypothetical protein JKP88DRAFT_155437, partial [Tribonema minus]
LAGQSLLRHLGRRVTGVMVPWLYVGSTFSAFCWHVEDHRLYSINYHHFGAPKRWYGVPGAAAEAFEDAARALYPDLFASQPDLLHQLVTMISPAALLRAAAAAAAAAGTAAAAAAAAAAVAAPLRVCALTQRPGEFVVTLPRAYHAGLNLGVNCAEAVNFAPPDWLAHSWRAQEALRRAARPPVFSHEGLVLALARRLLAAPARAPTRTATP